MIEANIILIILTWDVKHYRKSYHLLFDVYLCVCSLIQFYPINQETNGHENVNSSRISVTNICGDILPYVLRNHCKVSHLEIVKDLTDSNKYDGSRKKYAEITAMNQAKIQTAQCQLAKLDVDLSVMFGNFAVLSHFILVSDFLTMRVG